VTPLLRRALGAALVSAALVAAVTAAIAVLEPNVPALGLGVLYLFAVVPVALRYGLAAAVAASLASMAVYDYFFLADRNSFDPGSSQFSKPPLAAIGLHGRVTTARASSRDVLDPFDVAFGLPKDDERWRGCVNAWVRDLLDSGRMTKRLDYWLAQPVA
jgi:hypothetical protein